MYGPVVQKFKLINEVTMSSEKEVNVTMENLDVEIVEEVVRETTLTPSQICDFTYIIEENLKSLQRSTAEVSF